MKKTVIYPLSSSLAGGSFSSLLLLAKDLQDLYDIRIILPDKGDAYVRAKDAAYIDILKMNSLMLNARKHIANGIKGKLAYIIVSAGYFAKIPVYLLRKKVSLIHSNDLMTTIYWGLWGKLLGIPVIWHVRQEKSSKILDKIRLFVSTRLVFLCKLNMRKFSPEILQKIEYDVVYNGVDTELFYPRREGTLYRELDLDRNTVLVGFAGYFMERKRPELFIESAIGVLKRNVQNVHFVVVGKAPHKSDYENRLKDMVYSSGYEKNFTFLGYREDMHAIMSDLDIFCMTSTFDGEAFPRVVLEAMASECAVVSTDTAGVPEIIDDGVNGIICPADQGEKMVDALTHLISDPKNRNYLAANARKKAAEKFSSTETSKKIAAVYEDLLY